MTKYEIKNTTQFKKDYKLTNGEPLDAKYTGTHSDLFNL